VEFVILGPTTLRTDEGNVPLGAAKQRAMLAVLLYHVRAPVRAATVVECLWGDGRTLDDCRMSLYSLASRIRAALGSVGLSDALVRVPSISGYRLDVDPYMIDFYRFRRIAADARQAAGRNDHATAVELLTEALALWHDEPLADLRGPHAEHLRRRMNDSLLDANKVLAGGRLKLGQYQSVLVLLEPLLTTNDLDETLAQQWIMALCAAGRYDDARTFLAGFRRRFRREMKTEPTVDLPDAARTKSSPVPSSGTRTPGPAAQPAAAGPRQLPKDIHDFTGHDDLLTELDQMAARRQAGPNVAVISGMPGAGKTTLATHWAHRQRHHFPDGQLYLNAHGYGPGAPVNPDDALGWFLRALDVPADRVPADMELRRDRFNRLLNGRRVLIVLDNVKDSDQVRPLLPATETCFTLITSRIRLRGLTIRDSARNLTMTPLPDNHSRALLTRTIGTARAAADPDSVQALARLAGGLPLALRIIGEHIAERPRATIADLVDELNGHVLDCEGEDDGETNLRTVFAWSYDALRADAAHMFRILGLHPGPTVSAGSAAAMLGVEPAHAEQLLNTLAKTHLINHGAARRYHFHDLIRLYAADRAQRDEPAGPQQEAMRRLLDWYLLSAGNAAALLAPERPPVPDLPLAVDIQPQTFPSDTDAMRWCETERHNLGAATRWAVKNGFHRHGWQIPAAVHDIFDRYDRQDDVLELHELALSAAQLDGHQLGQIGTLNNLSVTHVALHNYERAATSLTAALELARTANARDAETVCSHNLAAVHAKTGDTDTAIDIYRRVLRTCREMANPAGEAATLHSLAKTSRQLKRYSEAIDYCLDALAIRERIGSPRGQGDSHGLLARLYLETGKLDLALTHGRLAGDIHARTNDQAARCDTLITMADIHRELAQPDAALRDAQHAVAISEKIADSHLQCRALAALADTYATTGHVDTARHVCDEALAILDEIPDPQMHPVRDRLQATTDMLGRATTAVPHEPPRASAGA
jgi:tetratricopeptide (TPR) repeat protein